MKKKEKITGKIDDDGNELLRFLSLDMSKKTKKELLELAAIEKDYDIVEAYKKYQYIEPYFSAIHTSEKISAYEKYIQDGGEEDGFEFKSPENEGFFDKWKSIRREYKRFKSNQQQQRKKNVGIGEEIIENIREVLKKNESRKSIDRIRELQNQWSSLNGFSPNKSGEMYKTYNALLDIYYDNRSIYRDLKELDRQKNLKKKLEICANLESLSNDKENPNIFRYMGQYKNEYYRIGPVPKDVFEDVKKRFNQAIQTLMIYKAELVAARERDRKENQNKKSLLLKQIKNYSNFKSDSFKEWSMKTKEIKELQSEWEAIGAMTKSLESDQITKEFWYVLKTFFSNKKIIYKDAEKERKENLKKKNKLIEIAMELKSSTDWEKTTKKLIEIQKKWKKIGPVPKKISEENYNKFRETCNHFFERLKEHRKEHSDKQKVNLKSKSEIIDKINNLDKEKNNAEDLKKLTDEYKNVGEISFKQQGSIEKKFEIAVDTATKKLGIKQDISSEIFLENDIEYIKNSANPEKAKQEVKRKFKRRIGGIEKDISLIENNLSLFTKPANRNNSKKNKSNPLDSRLNAYAKQLEEYKAKIVKLQHQYDIIYRLKVD